MKTEEFLKRGLASQPDPFLFVSPLLHLKLGPMRKISALLALLLLVCATATPAKSRHNASRAVIKTSATKTSVSAKKNPVAGKRLAGGSSKARAAKGKKGRAVASRPRGQGSPTSDRYMEIQQALAAKGFYTGPVNGEWGPESVDALKRFQEAQSLKPDGKLGALSLISLGLGPKHDNPATVE